MEDIERRAHNTGPCPGSWKELLRPSNNYVHGSITIDSNGVGGSGNGGVLGGDEGGY